MARVPYPSGLGRRRSRKKRRGLGGADRFVVSGPARWKRSFHSTITPAMAAAKRCSKEFPNAICRVTEGLPGLQRVVAECNRSECYQANGLGKRKRRRKARR